MWQSSIFTHIIVWWSILENPYLSLSTSKWDVESQYENITMSTKTFIQATKNDSHSKVPEIGVEHRRAQFQFNLRSCSKMTITFSTELGLRQFKSHLKDNSLTYPHTKNYKLQWVQQVWLCTKTYLGLKTELSEYETEIWEVSGVITQNQCPFDQVRVLYELLWTSQRPSWHGTFYYPIQKH